ncbi:hypothetical protein GQ42DRAFT_177178 [Ramicandelaber brevisporus]|nr:hypothetical protein GQ42DRAFT_177178 [Ramicandelaber brevisporus]
MTSITATKYNNSRIKSAGRRNNKATTTPPPPPPTPSPPPAAAAAAAATGKSQPSFVDKYMAAFTQHLALSMSNCTDSIMKFVQPMLNQYAMEAEQLKADCEKQLASAMATIEALKDKADMADRERDAALDELKDVKQLNLDLSQQLSSSQSQAETLQFELKIKTAEVAALQRELAAEKKAHMNAGKRIRWSVERCIDDASLSKTERRLTLHDKVTARNMKADYEIKLEALAQKREHMSGIVLEHANLTEECDELRDKLAAIREKHSAELVAARKEHSLELEAVRKEYSGKCSEVDNKLKHGRELHVIEKQRLEQQCYQVKIKNDELTGLVGQLNAQIGFHQVQLVQQHHVLMNMHHDIVQLSQRQHPYTQPPVPQTGCVPMNYHH